MYQIFDSYFIKNRSFLKNFERMSKTYFLSFIYPKTRIRQSYSSRDTFQHRCHAIHKKWFLSSQNYFKLLKNDLRDVVLHFGIVEMSQGYKL